MGLLWFLPNFWQAPALLVLQHTHEGQNINWAVPARSGQYASPTQGLSVSGWTIEPGAALSGGEPPDRIVRFYVPGRVKPRLLCMVSVRYFPLHNEWVPYYRIDEEMFFSHKGGRWLPLTLMNGVPALITYTPIGFANAAGYYEGLSFSQTTGPITLVGWTVMRAPQGGLPSP